MVARNKNRFKFFHNIDRHMTSIKFNRFFIETFEICYCISDNGG